jgi:hypothetical protein
MYVGVFHGFIVSVVKMCVGMILVHVSQNLVDFFFFFSSFPDK